MELKKIAENHGLTPEDVDYALTQCQIVINEITHGMMSKLSYDAKDIIRMAQERWCDTCELKEQEPIKPDYDPYYQEWSCGNCGQTIIRAYNFCNYCGRKVNWK